MINAQTLIIYGFAMLIVGCIVQEMWIQIRRFMKWYYDTEKEKVDR